MRDMTSFAKDEIFEGRKSPTEPSETKVVSNGKVVDKAKTLKDAEKPNAAKKLNWAVDEPTDNDAMKYADRSEWNDNMIAIRGCLKAEEPFFIIGHSGWGKTEVIKSIAKKFGYTIITVYLDKACAEDLGGIPVPMEGAKNSVYQELALPGWAAYILDNPDTKFLLFFDEMNQADPAVMNALMPIVKDNVVGNIKIENYLACAAGNYKDENHATHELSDPLEQRFVYLVWEDKTPEEWAHNFQNFMHPKWDPLVGKELVDMFEKNCKLFKSPRVIDQKILQAVYKIKQAGPDEWEFYNPKFYKKLMNKNLEDNLERTEQEDVDKIAEYLDEWMRSDNNTGKTNTRNREALDAPQQLKDEIKHGMELGWIWGDDWDEKRTKWAFARDILGDLFYMDDFCGEGPITMEQIMQEVKKNEKMGIKFKYETAKEAFNDGMAVEDDIRKRLGF